jgi:rod shape determining protein RodA
MVSYAMRPAPPRAPPRGDSYAARLDWPLLVAAVSLAGLGALLVWSASRADQVARGADPDAYLKRHLLNLAIGLVLGAIASVVDYRLLRAYAR